MVQSVCVSVFLWVYWTHIVHHYNGTELHLNHKGISCTMMHKGIHFLRRLGLSQVFIKWPPVFMRDRHDSGTQCSSQCQSVSSKCQHFLRWMYLWAKIRCITGHKRCINAGNFHKWSLCKGGRVINGICVHNSFAIHVHRVANLHDVLTSCNSYTYS